MNNRYKIYKDEKKMLGFFLYLSIFIIVFVPLILVVIWSFISKESGWFAPAIFPSQFALDQWKTILATGGVVQSIFLSVFISFAVVFLTSVVSLPAAFALARFPFKLKRIVELYFLAPMIVPGIVVAIGLGEIFYQVGLNQTVLGTIFVQMVGVMPLMTRILTSVIEKIPSDVLFAARTLGASPFNMIMRIAVPMAMPGFVAGGLLSFISSFEEFERTFIIGAPIVQTLPVKLFSYLDGYSIVFPFAAVVTILLLLPVVVIFYLAGKIAHEDVMASGMGKL